MAPSVARWNGLAPGNHAEATGPGGYSLRHQGCAPPTPLRLSSPECSASHIDISSARCTLCEDSTSRTRGTNPRGVMVCVLMRHGRGAAGCLSKKKPGEHPVLLKRYK